MAAFPMDAEQIVRLVAAVMAERILPRNCDLDDRPDALLLRLADAAGVPLETFALPQGRSRPADVPRPRSTHGLGVMPYKRESDLAAIAHDELVEELRRRLDGITDADVGRAEGGDPDQAKDLRASIASYRTSSER